MILTFVAFLLTVQMVISANLTVHTVISANGTTIDTQYLSPIDTLSYGAFRIPIFRTKEVTLAQPVITVKSCPFIVRESLQYSIVLRVKIDKNPLKTAVGINFSHLVADISYQILAYGDFKDANETKIHFEGFSYFENLHILCSTLENCYTKWVTIITNTSQLDAVKFNASGVARKFNGLEELWKFSEIRIAPPIKLNCSWNLIKKSDDMLPRSPETHTGGFMWNSPLKVEYWMGLQLLHFITVKTNPNKCKLIIELEDWKGNSYWGQWNQFQVMGPADNYQLKVGEEVAGTLINGLDQYYALKYRGRNTSNSFDIYDYDEYYVYYWKHLNERIINKSCSTRFKYIGWWFNPCFSVGTNLVPMKKSEMKVNCGWK